MKRFAGCDVVCRRRFHAYAGDLAAFAVRHHHAVGHDLLTVRSDHYGCAGFAQPRDRLTVKMMPDIIGDQDEIRRLGFGKVADAPGIDMDNLAGVFELNV
jgi:hypothetical protein